VTVQGPDGEETPDERDSAAPRSEELWLKFLTDSEVAIRRSAPKEASAQERASAMRSGAVTPAHRTERRPLDAAARYGTEAVGDLWRPDDLLSGPAWRDLDGRARLRRVVRVIATAVTIAVVVGAWSWLSTSAGNPDGNDTPILQLEETPPGLFPATRSPLGSAVAEPSTAATG
jgi:hypothetical protein